MASLSGVVHSKQASKKDFRTTCVTAGACWFPSGCACCRNLAEISVCSQWINLPGSRVGHNLTLYEAKYSSSQGFSIPKFQVCRKAAMLLLCLLHSLLAVLRESLSRAVFTEGGCCQPER